MPTRVVVCPNCGNKISISGSSGDRIEVVCPKCGSRGAVSFPEKNVIIEVKSLSKYYNGVKAVDEISFSVEEGEIFGFLGPNGAGKTTTIKLLMGLTHPSNGEIRVYGEKVDVDSVNIRRNIGYLPEKIAFYDNLTPLQTLRFLCELKGVEKSIAEDLLEEVGLGDAIHRKVGTFSKGMIQLLGIAQAMIGNPRIYVFDEPMSGLDAKWVKTVRDKIKELNEKGATVFLSSHILSEVQNLCHRVAVINKGKIIAEDTISNLSKRLRLRPKLEFIIPGLNGTTPEGIYNVKGVIDAEAKGDILTVTCETRSKQDVIKYIQSMGLEISDFKTIEPSLEDTFIKLISEEGS